MQAEHLALRARAEGLESSAADSTALFSRQESQLETLRILHAEAEAQSNAREAETKVLRADLDALQVASAARERELVEVQGRVAAADQSERTKVDNLRGIQ